MNVFVYGTLKRGFGNSVHLQGSQFMGIAETVARYPLFVDVYAVPYLVDDEGFTGSERVVGEMFLVNDKTMNRLDILEGVAQGRYIRKQISVEASDGERSTAAAYMLPKTAHGLRLESRTLIKEYSAEVHEKFVPRENRDASRMASWGGFE